LNTTIFSWEEIEQVWILMTSVI